ncbi:MAG TPA: hypothetical protein VHX36_08550 [Candidatus Acidoferrales bacterium]|jgi:hypothetical protein|nr:hypothetical protein [Candidatus Acidoferrales bacterium]
MSDPRPCEECLAILEELRVAYIESGVALPFGSEVQSSRDAFSKILTGTEEEIDAVLARYPFRAQALVDSPEYRNPKIAAALRKMIGHRARTGHRFPFWK